MKVRRAHCDRGSSGGSSERAARFEWETVCEVVEVEDQRRWVWNVLGIEGIAATWGFEVEPASDGVLIRQWARLGPGTSGLTIGIANQPNKEARIVARRLSEWLQNMQANREWIRSHVETVTVTAPAPATVTITQPKATPA